jgi:hypothetical protein
MPQRRKYDTDAQRQAAYRHRAAQTTCGTLLAYPVAPSLATVPAYRRWRALVGAAERGIQTVVDELQSYFEERTEAWQESERGEDFSALIEAAEQALAMAEELLQGLPEKRR